MSSLNVLAPRNDKFYNVLVHGGAKEDNTSDKSKYRQATFLHKNA